ncbi:hypothetical protein C484_07696 [Natrialba taiwanensis DSM 12281]|uniref:Uncharacterized protein n=1 Tax=Natrialba taiwanensis DSM 12281 TaxID=1230458 RepID=M0A5X6_9EURY|nr:hypothetical protein C484_07696 [Natrialba taiwanensis DSM 12281]
MDVVTVMWMVAPAEIHAVSVRIVKFVVCSSRPLNINPGGFRTTESVLEQDFQNRRIKVVIKRWRCEWLFSLDNITNREERWPVDRSSE